MAAATRIIAIASGKGGVGKTNVSLNLAWALARQGRRVCLLDADLGLSNVDVLLGIRPDTGLEQVLFHGLPLREAVTQVATGIDLVPGSSGVARMAELNPLQRQRLAREFALLSGYDFVLVDNSPGISPQVLALCLSAQELVLVVNPEITSLTDAYALVKVLRGRGLNWPPLVLVNRSPGETEARLVFRRLQHTAQKHLGLNCAYLGALPEDPRVGRAAALQRPVLEAFPASPFALAMAEAARKLTLAASASVSRAKDAAQFWDASVCSVLASPEAAPAPRPPESGASARPGAGGDILREAQAMRALFERLNFQGAPEPLRRIAEAGAGHARRLMLALARLTAQNAALSATRHAPPAITVPPAQPAGPEEQPEGPAALASCAGKVLVRCPDRDLAHMVADIVREQGHEPVLPGRSAERNGELAADLAGVRLCVLAGAEPEGAQALAAGLAGAPIIVLDESFGRNRAGWLALPGVCAVLPVPFRVLELERAMQAALGCAATGTGKPAA